MSDGMITQTYSLDLVPGGNQLVVNVSQYDKLGRLLVFNLYQAGLAYSIPSGTGATIKGTKPDGKGFDYAMTVGNGKVSIIVPQQMTAVAGDTVCEVMLTDSAGNTIATANFILSVEHAAMDDATVVSDSDIPVFEGLVAQATTQAANASASASKAATSATASANSASASASSAAKAETAYNNTKPLIPTNTGAVGQVLTKTSSGSQWETDSSTPIYKTIAVDLTNWSSSTTTVSGVAYYTAVFALSGVYDEHPTISIAPVSTVPTTAEETAYSCIKNANVSGTTLTLYATSKPATAVSINVEGVK
jgi:hypothetical protein